MSVRERLDFILVGETVCIKPGCADVVFLGKACGENFHGERNFSYVNTVCGCYAKLNFIFACIKISFGIKVKSYRTKLLLTNRIATVVNKWMKKVGIKTGLCTI